MKRREIFNQASDRSDEGYVFLAEALDEMLFDYTLDTYKPSTHNASTLSYEVTQIIDDIKSEIISDKAHFDEALDELRWMLGEDDIAKNLLTTDPQKLLEGLTILHSAAAKSKVSLVSAALNPANYLNACASSIKVLAAEGREKTNLLKVTRRWVTSLIQVGYARRYISFQVRWAFFERSNAHISLKDRLDMLMSKFDLGTRNFTVFAVGADLFSDIRAPCKDLGWIVSDAKPSGASDLWLSRVDKHRFPLFIYKEKIRAKDRFSASKFATENLDQISGIFSLFHHKKSLSWEPAMQVREVGDAEGDIVGRPVNPVTRVLDAFPKRAASRMHEVMSELELQEESFDQFARVVSLHGAAIRSESTSVQLLNIWSALEALVPSCVHGAKVKSVVDALTPYLLLEYPQMLVEDLLADLFRWNKKEAKAILHIVEIDDGLRPANQLLKFMVLSEYEEARRALMNRPGF